MIGRRRKTRPFRFKPFSRRQLQLLTWWREESPYADADGVIAQGAIRSGKTVAAILGFVLWSFFAFPEGEDFIIAGRTMGALRRNVLNPLFRILSALGIAYHYNRSSEAPHVVIGKHIYYLFGANNERAQDVLQGFTGAGALADEAVLFPESFIEQMIGRCSVEGAKIWMTCNPGGPFHYFKLKFVDQAKKKRLLDLHFTLDDNPALSERIKARFRRMFTGMFFQRYILGLWALAEGLIYELFDQKRHVVGQSEIPTWFPHYGVSIDHGSPAPTVFGLFAWGAPSCPNKVFLLNLYYYDGREEGKKAKTDSEFADDFERWIGPYRDRAKGNIICDPAPKHFILELESRGFSVQSARNDLLPGIRFVQQMMAGSADGGEPDFVLADRTEMQPALMEYSTYSWDPKAQERGEDVPIKGNDHALDMIRYFLFTVIWPLRRKDYDVSGWALVKG